MLVGHNLHLQWSLGKQNEAINLYNCLMSSGNIYYASKSLSEETSDSLKECIALDMKQ